MTDYQNIGLVRELNPGPPTPEAGIMPLDQQAKLYAIEARKKITNSSHFSRNGKPRIKTNMDIYFIVYLIY